MKAFDERAGIKGLLLSLKPDEVVGYRAEIWFEYTRELFNLLREGSLVAARNFSDRDQAGGDRSRERYEFTILQIDRAMPWHYAIQGSESGFPGFVVASAESSFQAWTENDLSNDDDVTRIRCEAVPVRLAFCDPDQEDFLAFADRSMPMPGGQVHLLSRDATDAIINHGLDEKSTFALGHHVVQRDVEVRIAPHELLGLHFGIFGFTGAGKSNLTSTLIRRSLASKARPHFVVFDLMDEYTGLLIDQLVTLPNSRIVVAGRKAVGEELYKACVEATDFRGAGHLASAVGAASSWQEKLILPREIRKAVHEGRIKPKRALYNLIMDGKVQFYETLQQQGAEIAVDLGAFLTAIGPKALADGTEEAKRRVREEVQPLLAQANAAQGEPRDEALHAVIALLEEIFPVEGLTTKTAQTEVPKLKERLLKLVGSRGSLARSVSTYAKRMRQDLLESDGPSLTIVIGEDEGTIATLARQLIDDVFEARRTSSKMDPIISFFFDEADVFIKRRDGDKDTGASVVEQATLLARRGRKFGLGLGLATQRIRYLDTSIMAQPHTYFVSKLPRKSDRDAVAEAFAISEDSFSQTFGFGAGQWLVTSHDATGLKGTPFPVQAPNANGAVIDFLASLESNGSTG